MVCISSNSLLLATHRKDSTQGISCQEVETSPKKKKKKVETSPYDFFFFPFQGSQNILLTVVILVQLPAEQDQVFKTILQVFSGWLQLFPTFYKLSLPGRYLEETPSEKDCFPMFLNNSSESCQTISTNWFHESLKEIFFVFFSLRFLDIPGGSQRKHFIDFKAMFTRQQLKRFCYESCLVALQAELSFSEGK